jgi:REP element-mobilizing transposase RayT
LQDHVHVFVTLHPSMPISHATRLLKGISSREIFWDFPWLKTKYRTGHQSFDPLKKRFTQANIYILLHPI